MAKMEEPDINKLTVKVAQLIDLCDRLQQQNQRLHVQEKSWKEERMQLIEKNDLARQKVEAMISRLKSLEHDA
jgi:cell division protein ZapB